jgi:hypothetical protein
MFHFDTPWWMSCSDTDVAPPSHYKFLHPSYDSSSNPRRFPATCYSFAHFPTPYATNVLEFELYGQLTSEILGLVGLSSSTGKHGGGISESEQCKVDDAHSIYPPTSTAYMLLLRYFSPYLTRLAPCVSSSPPPPSSPYPFPRPTSILLTHFSASALSGYGSYTNFQIGLTCGLARVNALRDGWEAGRVWIAGEHCGEVVGLGSVTGAWWGGEKAARDVESFLRRQDELHG